MTAEAGIEAPVPNPRPFADDIVQRLAARETPSVVDEQQPGWNDAFIGAIRDFKEPFRASPDLKPALDIASEDLYGREIHWALELIQNAEDAGARRITFVFDDDRVTVSNDGDAFSLLDVWGICSAGHSPKKNKIGFFGIGFKSVYMITDVPEVVSGPYAFRIHDKIYPEPLGAAPLRRPRGARFVLPVRVKDRARLDAAVRDLTQPEFLHLLLTLTRLETIRIVDRRSVRMRGRFYRAPLVSHERHDQDWDECVIGGSWPGCEPQTWRRYRIPTAPIPEGIQRRGRDLDPGSTSIVVLARPVGRPVVPSQLHCFLPLDVISELRWLVQADFDPTPGRERPRDNAWNRWLFGQVGAAIGNAILREARSGGVPWDLVPLAAEVTSPLQRTAHEAAVTALKHTPFVRATTGWRSPGRSCWPSDPALGQVLREADLELATGADISYVRPSQLGSPESPDRTRAIAVLRELGAREIGVSDLLRLIGLPDDAFAPESRPGTWWLKALDAVARLGGSQEKDVLSRTACLPLAGGGRIAPSPAVDLRGYLVAYARSGSLADLHSYFTATEVLLLDHALEPRPESARRSDESELDRARARVRDLLTSDRFHVAPEAGPYHVVVSLILPRMNALAALDALDEGQRDQLRRMVEFIRHRWRGYVSDYRRWKSARMDETQLARQLGAEIKVSVLQGTGRSRRAVARPLATAYVPSSMNPGAQMDIALAGSPALATIDDVHARALPVPRVRGVRHGTRAQMDPEAFLRFLGAPLGPRITSIGGEPAAGGLVHRLGWGEARWATWPTAALGRPHGLLKDWTSDDVAWLIESWPEWSSRQRERRGRALWGSIAADWDRLAPMAVAQPVYYYYQWNVAGAATMASWLGQLSQLDWVPAVDRSLRPPTLLALNSAVNKLSTGGNDSLILAPGVGPEAVALALGVRPRPPDERVVETLQDLRDRSDTLDPSVVRRAAAACYETLSASLEAADASDREDLLRWLRPKFTGNGRVGLIYAPPPVGIEGRSWWPPARAVTGDVARDAGPYVGHLSARYRNAGLLWDVLGVAKDLSPDFIVDLIRHELSIEPPSEAASHFYGQLVMRVEQFSARGPAPTALPALTTKGWVAPEDARWTSRHEFRQAFGHDIAWWTPGSFDASLLVRAARWLGIVELDQSNVTERWQPIAVGTCSEDVAKRWRLALQVWPWMLRSEGGNVPDAERVAAAVDRLSVGVALAIEGELSTVGPDGQPIDVTTRPACLLRRDEDVFLATSEAALFSRDAADALSTLVPSERLHAANTLFALLVEIEQRPADFARKYAGLVGSGVEVQLEDWEDDPGRGDIEAGLAAIRTAQPRNGDKGRLPVRRPPVVAPPVRRFADPTAFELDSIEDLPPKEVTSATTDNRKEGRRHAAPKPEDSGGASQKRETRAIPSNTAVEDAARPYVERFELKRGGHVIHRQAPLVGADYIADDGRYIEVKAAGGSADDAFDLEQSEWSAALDPVIRADYWVYVVEHLTDGGVPVVTAIENPVRDQRVGQAPVGKMRVSRWRSAQVQKIARFRRRDQ